jgi:quercetin dioxygenase-like cupin family protein
MKAFEFASLLQQHQTQEQMYLEFLRVPDLSMGLYILPAGGRDPQQPHEEDEVYYVVRGKGLIDVDGEDRPVQAGSLVYVPAHVPHHFHTIEEELQVLVFFAPAESSSDQAA